MPNDTTATPAPNGAGAALQTEAPPPVEAQPVPMDEASRIERTFAILNGTLKPEGMEEEPAEEGQPAPPVVAKDEGAPKEPPQEKPDPKRELLSKSFAELARKERELRAEREKLKTQETKPPPSEPKADESDGELDLSGLSKEQRQALFQALTDEALTGKLPEGVRLAVKAKAKAAPVPTEEELLKKLEEHPRFKEMAAQVQQLSSRAQKAEEMQFKSDVRKLAEAEGDKYELFLEKGGEQHVWDVLDAHYKENGALPGDGTIEDARRIAMDHIQAVFQAEVDATLKLKAVQRKLTPVAPKPAVPGHETTGQKPSAPQLRTLSNSMAGAPPRTTPKRATEEERAAEALRILHEGG